MPVKKRQSKQKDRPVTPEAVVAFKAGDWMGLYTALKLKPWEWNPLDVDPEHRPAWFRGELQERSWERAVELRICLESRLLTLPAHTPI